MKYHIILKQGKSLTVDNVNDIDWLDECFVKFYAADDTIIALVAIDEFMAAVQVIEQQGHICRAGNESD